ncbi:chemotaxis protein CheW [Hahella ganghwensis]|uniref:chemotaxis protein CheW n=1 Tax=Hahella ganghwensis TaxID=286420 RepID=UPI000381264C|nr:chemotaxis protein CheW [Hahella ganghwensis]
MKISESMDWDALKRQLEQNEAALAKQFAPSDQAVQQRLLERAKALARSSPVHQEQSSTDWLLFSVADEVYAINPVYVVSVIPIKHITQIPCTPTYVLGVVGFRGRMISVIDLRILFDLPVKGLTDRNSLVILSSGQMEFGLLTDQVRGVEALDDSKIYPPPANITSNQADYLHGITLSQYAVLDAVKLLTDTRLIVNTPV